MAPLNVPAPWPGTEAERIANHWTHHFDTGQDDGDARCWDCDARPTHIAADYPCGVQPPRMIIEVPDRQRA